MPALAAPCTGHEPLILERGRCFRCGRFLASEIGTAEEAWQSIGYAALGIAVEREARAMRRQAEDAGYLDTPERYARWLEARLKHMAEQERRRAHNPTLGPRFGASVRSPLAPVVL